MSDISTHRVGPASVKQQKWWGWGAEGTEFSFADKPKFAPFVLSVLGVDVRKPAPRVRDFASLDVPPRSSPRNCVRPLSSALGDEFVIDDDELRVVHAFGRGVRDLVRVRRGQLGRVPDVVVYPGSPRTTSSRSSTRPVTPTRSSSRTAAARTSSGPSRPSPPRPVRSSASTWAA
jgi:hypothetical protein